MKLKKVSKSDRAKYTNVKAIKDYYKEGSKSVVLFNMHREQYGLITKNFSGDEIDDDLLLKIKKHVIGCKLYECYDLNGVLLGHTGPRSLARRAPGPREVTSSGWPLPQRRAPRPPHETAPDVDVWVVEKDAL